jgi:hypothetical protein
MMKKVLFALASLGCLVMESEMQQPYEINVSLREAVQ